MVDIALTERIAQRLKSARRLRGYTQTQAGALLGVSPQQWQKYEAGMNRISAVSLAHFAAALQLPIAYFFEDEFNDRIIQRLYPLPLPGLMEEATAEDINQLYHAIPSPELRYLLYLSAQMYQQC